VICLLLLLAAAPDENVEGVGLRHVTDD